MMGRKSLIFLFCTKKKKGGRGGGSEGHVQDFTNFLYPGGKEHAYLHLYFARFISHFLHSINLLGVQEPFSNLITQGMVKGQSYRIKVCSCSSISIFSFTFS